MLLPKLIFYFIGNLTTFPIQLWLQVSMPLPSIILTVCGKADLSAFHQETPSQEMVTAEKAVGIEGRNCTSD